MIALLHRDRRWVVVAMIAWSWVADDAASAQTLDQQAITPSSLAAVKARVPVGEVIYVTDMNGTTIKGRLADLTDDAVKVKIESDVRSVAGTDVRRIQWQRPDSPVTGVLIGAAVGAIPGIYWLAADPNECTGMCPEDYALIAVGAVVGGVIDHAITKRVTVYAAGTPGGRAKSVTIGPLVMRGRHGVQLAVTY